MNVGLFLTSVGQPVLNDGISKDFFLGEPVELTYPTVDDIED